MIKGNTKLVNQLGTCM